MVAGGKSEEIKIPIPFYVIRHPKGIILFDAGLSREFPDQEKSWWAHRLEPVHRLFQRLLPSEFKPAESAADQLIKMGISPEEVKFIILSHLHYDHSSGVQDFPNARIVVSKKEWERSQVNRWRARLRGIMLEPLKNLKERVQTVDFLPESQWGPFDGSDDLFHDGSLILLFTPGHTPGHQSLLVTFRSGRKILLTSDAVWVQENYLWPTPKGWFVRNFEEDRNKAWETTLKIRKFHEEHPEILIIPGHDPHLWIKLAPEYR